MGLKLSADWPVVTNPKDVPEGYVPLTTRWQSHGAEYQRVRRGIQRKEVRAIELVLTSRNKCLYVNESDALSWIESASGRCAKGNRPAQVLECADRLEAVLERIARALEELATKPSCHEAGS